MTNKEKFGKSDGFAVQVMAKGSFVDDSTGDGKTYLVEAFTLRLNHVALNAWVMSQTFNCRECYNTDEEWEEYKAKIKAKRDAWNEKVVDILGIDPEAGSVCITQAQSEVFTAVYIREVA